jgi:hypothetical protein
MSAKTTKLAKEAQGSGKVLQILSTGKELKALA